MLLTLPRCCFLELTTISFKYNASEPQRTAQAQIRRRCCKAGLQPTQPIGSCPCYIYIDETSNRNKSNAVLMLTQKRPIYLRGSPAWNPALLLHLACIYAQIHYQWDRSAPICKCWSWFKIELCHHYIWWVWNMNQFTLLKLEWLQFNEALLTFLLYAWK